VLESRAWLQQAISDLHAGDRERAVVQKVATLPPCHAVGKYQQCVEKAIKAIIVALREAGFTNWQIGCGHEVTDYFSMLFRISRAGGGKNILQTFGQLLDGNTRAAIKSLESLAPRWPAPGAQFPRNTEYPFQDPSGSWTYPAMTGTFSTTELADSQRLAHRVDWGVQRILSAIARTPK